MALSASSNLNCNQGFWYFFFQLIILFPSLLSSNWKYLPSRELVELSGLGKLFYILFLLIINFFFQYKGEVKFVFAHLYTRMERGTLRVKCLAQEHMYNGAREPELKLNLDCLILSVLRYIDLLNYLWSEEFPVASSLIKKGIRPIITIYYTLILDKKWRPFNFFERERKKRMLSKHRENVYELCTTFHSFSTHPTPPTPSPTKT